MKATSETKWSVAPKGDGKIFLPELKSGDVLISASGRKVIVKRLSRPKRDTGFVESLYRLVHLLETGKELTGNAEWTLDELNSAGMKMA